MTDTPKKISKYHIKGVLGQGAMGVVYLGFDEQIERKVAIKTVAFDASNDHNTEHDLADRFVQEAKLLAKCTHPNIVTILDFGQQDNVAYMVMEYIQGLSLKDLLKKNHSLPLMLVMAWFIQLLKALHVAHQNGIIHRDLKPENILLVNNKTIKLTDFGIAKSEDNSTLTQVGVAIGTPKYMSPEQIFGSAEIGPSSDIYSLFVILFELLGHVTDYDKYLIQPFSAVTQLAKHNKFDEDTLVPLIMDEFILQGLSLSHLDRFESVPDVVTAFKPILQQLKSQATQQNTQPSDDETSGFFTTGTVVTHNANDWIVDDQKFTAMRDHLSELMGPMADFILTNALKHAQSEDQFIMQIAEKIDNQTIREDFIDHWRSQ